MTSDRTIDLVHRAEEFHRLLAAHYRRLRSSAKEERVKLALDYLIQQQTAIEGSLRAYEVDAPALVAERWFKYSPAEELRKLLEATPIQADIDLAELGRQAVEFGNCLIRFYKQFAETALPEDLGEVMSKLLSLEEEEQKKMTDALQQGL
ncbi:MAG: hypothetical protein HYV26_09275 [Candidatus Hydrogenedentes bacterium]|nr:hypothetical protein [Candidatus Hydrogenedentota bacterium]